jgi:hypothetical protein
MCTQSIFKTDLHTSVVRMFAQFTKCIFAVEEVPGDNLKTNVNADHVESYIKRAFVKTATCGDEDVLKIPLQPLYDNLTSETYEIFEEDPRKYCLYQSAIEAALTEMVPEDEIETKCINLMVLGKFNYDFHCTFSQTFLYQALVADLSFELH